ncbi:MAG TPA: hypothetical protein VFF63_05565 [Candidatus Babeliales bacterium]|nr:hypothetical protein [Candidatus Babeliales bacterium]
MSHMRALGAFVLCSTVFSGCSSEAVGPGTPPGLEGLSRTSSLPDSGFKTRPDSSEFTKLAVSNYGQPGVGNVVLFSNKYKLTKTITRDISDNDGIWIDANENLYVANLHGTVTEYNSSGKLTFTYSSGMTNPVAVTTDGSGNVYVGESDVYPGHIDEFPQGSNTPIVRCATADSGLVTGVTVDKNGDVFIGSLQEFGSSQLWEYPGGLSGCAGTALPVPVTYIGGIELDNSGNLVVEEQTLDDILIIPPPYSNIMTTLTGFTGDPYQLALNADNTLLFVDEGNNTDVVVAQYPSGTIEKTLTNDITMPYGVAVYPPPPPAQ